MQPESLKLLDDIRDAGGFIIEMTRGKSLAEYREDRVLRQAIERNFEIIGEAMNRLRRADPVTAEGLDDVRPIIAFRNILIHGYNHIDHEIVWDVIETKLPGLLIRVDALLKNL